MALLGSLAQDPRLRVAVVSGRRLSHVRSLVPVPGILLAAWVRSLREPIRGMSEGLVTKPHPAPWKVLYEEMVSVLPGLSFAAAT